MLPNVQEPEKTTENVLSGEWLIRPCRTYSDEYADCRSLKARFHQYYIFGKTIDCSQWKRDADNCKKWTESKDLKAAAELVSSERSRRKERLTAHVGNTTWERRSSPPKDWSKPLPDHMQEEYEATYLNVKSKEMNGEGVVPQQEAGFCVIM